MKRIILTLTLLSILCMPCMAVRTESQRITQKIDEIGFTILNANGITKRTVFDYCPQNVKNAYSRTSDRQIVIYRGLWNKLQSDDEIAAVLSHEISHSVDSYGLLGGVFNNIAYNYCPKRFEYKADRRAVDYMVNAGYNPVALIVVMSKCFGQRRTDFSSTHPLTSKRMIAVYAYIYTTYPQYLENNVYENNLYYKNFLLTSQENITKFKAKLETNSKMNVRYK